MSDETNARNWKNFFRKGTSNKEWWPNQLNLGNASPAPSGIKPDGFKI
jgi:hypothetical protein